MHVYIYIYIYIERERDLYTCISREGQGAGGESRPPWMTAVELAEGVG